MFRIGGDTADDDECEHSTDKCWRSEALHSCVTNHVGGVRGDNWRAGSSCCGLTNDDGCGVRSGIEIYDVENGKQDKAIVYNE